MKVPVLVGRSVQVTLGGVAMVDNGVVLEPFGALLLGVDYGVGMLLRLNSGG